MPVVLPKQLPAAHTLKEEGVFIMTDQKAIHQDIRPLEICILNLMPLKEDTEYQLLRLLSNTPLQLNITFLRTATYQSRHTSSEHLSAFYKSYEEIKNRHFDGMIITGAPVECLRFEQVAYWQELKTLLDYAKTHVTSTLHICWAAQAGMYYHYGQEKHLLRDKLSGVFSHQVLERHHPLMRGFDQEFYMPHSRYTTTALDGLDGLDVLATSELAGASIVATRDLRQIYVSGHLEYTKDTLKKEYYRDLYQGKQPGMPLNYFTDNDPNQPVKMRWSSHAYLFFSNWLNYCVYQRTPYLLQNEEKI